MIVPLQTILQRTSSGTTTGTCGGLFGGTSDNSFDEETQTGITVGYSITDDEEMTPEIEKYVRELAKRYGQDDRVIIWNIWNELGNSGRGEKSLPMAKK